MAYVSDADFRRYVGSTITVDQDFVDAALDTAERLVNIHCGRSFDDTDAVERTRVYRPTCEYVFIDDLVDATGLVVAEDGTTVSSSLYQLEPLNNRSDSGETVPYYVIRRLNAWWYHDGAEATISVTSDRWGWGASVPFPVVEATKILAKDLVHMRDNRFGVADFGEYGAIRMRENPTVAMLLKDYRHPNTAPAVA